MRANAEIYDALWEACPDFSRFNPGARHRRRWIKRKLQRFAPRTVLDVGCGTGELLVWLRRELSGVETWTGVDQSEKTMIANAARDPGAEYAPLDIELAHLDRRFDVVICTEVVEHLSKRDAALENLFAMVAPGGHLVLTCPTGKVHATERHFGHVSHPSPRELRAQLERAGFASVTIENWGFPTYLASKYATNVSPDWALSRFATGRYDARAKAVSNALFLANFLNLKSSPLGCQLYVTASVA